MSTTESINQIKFAFLNAAEKMVDGMTDLQTKLSACERKIAAHELELAASRTELAASRTELAENRNRFQLFEEQIRTMNERITNLEVQRDAAIRYATKIPCNHCKGLEYETLVCGECIRAQFYSLQL